MTYQVTIQLYCGSLDVEVVFEDGYDPTEDELHDAAICQIQEELDYSKVDCWNAVG